PALPREAVAVTVAVGDTGFPVDIASAVDMAIVGDIATAAGTVTVAGAVMVDAAMAEGDIEVTATGEEGTVTAAGVKAGDADLADTAATVTVVAMVTDTAADGGASVMATVTLPIGAGTPRTPPIPTILTTTTPMRRMTTPRPIRDRE